MYSIIILMFYCGLLAYTILSYAILSYAILSYAKSIMANHTRLTLLHKGFKGNTLHTLICEVHYSIL
jgi:hypothetical protein